MTVSRIILLATTFFALNALAIPLGWLLVYGFDVLVGLSENFWYSLLYISGASVAVILVLTSLVVWGIKKFRNITFRTVLLTIEGLVFFLLFIFGCLTAWAMGH